MSRSKKHGKRPGTDLWKPGPMSGKSHSSENKKLDRRIGRKRGKASLRRGDE